MVLKLLYIYEIVLLFFLIYNSSVKCTKIAKMKLEDFIIDFVNGSYIDTETFNLEVVYHHSSNRLMMHVDIINALPTTINLKMIVLGRAFGKYNLPTGINLDMNLCDNKSSISLDKIWDIIGMNNTNCPPQPGTYEKNDFPADVLDLPLIKLPDIHVVTNMEVYSPPAISILKIRSFFFIL